MSRNFLWTAAFILCAGTTCIATAQTVQTTAPADPTARTKAAIDNSTTAPGERMAPGEKVAPYVPSATRVVDQMLELADVGSGDYLIDLGAGDGQIVLAAAALGAMGHGVELDGELVERARTTASDRGLADQTAFLQEDIFTTDFSKATVVTLYLMPAANARLRPMLLKNLAPGTRVVSNAFNMNEWAADEYQVGAAGSSIYLWVIPARAAGEWRFKLGNQDWRLDLTQEFQELTPQLSRGEDSLRVDKATLRGRNLQLITRTDDRRFTFHGRVQGDHIDGYVQIRDSNGDRIETWRAERAAGR